MAPKNGDMPTRTELPLSYFIQNEHMPLLRIVDFCHSTTGSVYLESTAVRLPDAIYRSAMCSTVRLFSEDYLLNFRRNSLEFGVLLGVDNYQSMPVRAALSLRELAEEGQHDRTEQIVELPRYQNIKTPLGVVLRSRRSRREMSGKPMSLQTLSNLLFYGDGATGKHEVVSEEKDPDWPHYSLGEPEDLPTRTAPTGGGLNPISLYLVLQNVRGLDDGVYQFLPLTHSLKRIFTFDEEKRQAYLRMSRPFGPNMEPAKINVTVFYVYSLYDNSRKYGDLGLLFGMVEVGQISQNLHLASTALDLASCDVGGVEKAQWERFFGLDGLSRHVLHVTVVGMPKAMGRLKITGTPK